MSITAQLIPTTKLGKAYLEVEKAINEINSKISSMNFKTISKIVILAIAAIASIALSYYYFPFITIPEIPNILYFSASWTFIDTAYSCFKEKIINDSIKFSQIVDDYMNKVLAKFDKDMIKSFGIKRYTTLDEIELDSFQDVEKRFNNYRVWFFKSSEESFSSVDCYDGGYEA